MNVIPYIVTFRSQFIKKSYGFIDCNENWRLFLQFQNMILSKVMTLKIKYFRKIEICDGLYNYLL